MDTVFTSWFFILIFWFSSMFSVEFASHVSRDYQAKELKEYAIQEIENYGGYTQDVQAKIEKRMIRYGLKDAGYTVEAPDSKIDYLEEFDFAVRGEFKYRAFNLLGSNLGTFTVPVSSKGSGIGQVYYR